MRSFEKELETFKEPQKAPICDVHQACSIESNHDLLEKSIADDQTLSMRVISSPPVVPSMDKVIFASINAVNTDHDGNCFFFVFATSIENKGIKNFCFSQFLNHFPLPRETKT